MIDHRFVGLSIFFALALGCAGDRSATPRAPVEPPPIVRAPECGYFGEGPELPPDVPVHVREPVELFAPAAIDPGRRYLGVSTRDGVSVVALAWGREVHRVRDSAPEHWAWIGPGRLVHRNSRGEMIAIDLDNGIWANYPGEAVPEHATMRPDAGLVAWLSASECAQQRCVFELSWARIGEVRQTAALGERPWADAEIAWVGRDGRVEVSARSTRPRGGEVRFMVDSRAAEPLPIRDSAKVIHEQWLASDSGYRNYEVGQLDAGGRWSAVHEFERDKPRLYGSWDEPGPQPLAVDRDGRRFAWVDGSTVRLGDLSTGALIDGWRVDSRIAAAALADGDCGVLVAERSGTLRYLIADSRGEDQRVRGVRAAEVRLVGGSMTGELELVIDGVFSRWEIDGVAAIAEVDDLHRAGPWLIERFKDRVEFSDLDAGVQRIMPWPEIGRDQQIRNAAAVSPDGRLAALSRWLDIGTGVKLGEAPIPGRVELHDLATGHMLWATALDPHTTALALTDDELWLAVHEGERTTMSVLDAQTGDVRGRWTTAALPAAVVAIAVDPIHARVYGLSPGQRRVWQWSTTGAFERELPLSLKPLPVSELGDCPCDLNGRWLQLSREDAELLIAAGGWQDELLRTADGGSVVVADQLGWPEQPGHALARDDGRIALWSGDAAEPLWSVQIYAGGEWVFWAPDRLRGYSPGAREMIAPALELRERPRNWK